MKAAILGMVISPFKTGFQQFEIIWKPVHNPPFNQRCGIPVVLSPGHRLEGRSVGSSSSFLCLQVETKRWMQLPAVRDVGTTSWSLQLRVLMPDDGLRLSLPCFGYGASPVPSCHLPLLLRTCLSSHGATDQNLGSGGCPISESNSGGNQWKNKMLIIKK